MKSLLYVLKTLLQINGVIAVLAFLTIFAMRQQKSAIVATSPESAKGFHRNIQDIPSDYQQQIETNRQQIEALKAEKDQQIKALQAQLATYQTPKDLTRSVSHAPSPQISVPKIAKTAPESARAKSQTTDQNNSAQRTQSPSNPIIHPSVAVQRKATPKLARQVNPSVESSNAANHALQETNQTLAMVSVPIFEEPNKQPLNSVRQEQPLTLVEQSKQRPIQSVKVAQLVVTPTATTPLKASIPLANDLAAGLIVAQREKQINYRTRTYKKVQTAIRSLRKGSSSSLEDAANQAQIEASVLKQVAEWGRERPGRFESTTVSLADSESTMTD
ncbi:hypothetical protein VB715_14780 [Crocosphaera sp. UHCC 0190]|uniref:hypothetical protein n=1 Tax=Crocosphaera sp. UHCC 0190 TaxID=3110246 RepID=UPI002B21C191|nr:hypothetical protein [Crocosphaera sp. UHCC 0190]MEA5511036.1 hypothetical protein [Crocosphaera sp. UHCC 0190]